MYCCMQMKISTFTIPVITPMQSLPKPSSHVAIYLIHAQRRSYRDLCQMKRSAFWCGTVERDRESPRKLWRSVNRERPPASSCITVDEFSRFFSEKVNAVRSNSDGAPEPCFPTCRLEHRWRSITSVTADDIVSAISRLPDKSSAADPLPVSVMKLVADEIAPFLTELFNRSMSAGYFPSTFKNIYHAGY